MYERGSSRGRKTSVRLSSLLCGKTPCPGQHAARSVVRHRPFQSAARSNAVCPVVYGQDIIFSLLYRGSLVHAQTTVRLVTGKFETQRIRVGVQKGAHPLDRPEVPVEASGNGRFSKSAIGDCVCGI